MLESVASVCEVTSADNKEALLGRASPQIEQSTACGSAWYMKSRCIPSCGCSIQASNCTVEPLLATSTQGCSIVFELMVDAPARVNVKVDPDRSSLSVELGCMAWSVDGCFVAHGVKLRLADSHADLIIAALGHCRGVILEGDANTHLNCQLHQDDIVNVGILCGSPQICDLLAEAVPLKSICDVPFSTQKFRRRYGHLQSLPCLKDLDVVTLQHTSECKTAQPLASQFAVLDAAHFLALFDVHGCLTDWLGIYTYKY